MSVITLTIEPYADPVTHTPTYYDELAAEFMDAFERMTSVLPKLQEAQAVTAKHALANLCVSDAFCLDAIDAVEQLPELDTLHRKFDVQRARNHFQFLRAFRQVETKAEAFANCLRHTLRAVKSALATSSLQIYRVAQSHARDGRSPAVAAHVALMKRTLGRRALTKAERDQRQAEKIREMVEAEVARRMRELNVA